MLIRANNTNSGQSLVEVVVSIAIAGIIIGASVTTLIIVLRSNLQSEDISRASFLNQELIDSARSIAEGHWRDIYDVEKGASHYIAWEDNETGEGRSPVMVKGTEGIVADDITSGLVGYWGLDEAEGDTAYDSSVNDNKGTVMGSLPQGGIDNCRVGGCLDFDGTDDYVDLGTSLVHGGQEMTVALWFKDDVDNSTTQRILSHNANSAGEYGFYRDGTDSIIFRFNGSTEKDITATHTKGIWQHAVGVIDGSGNGEFFLNGGLIDSTSGAGTTGSVGSLNIGRRIPSPTEYFNGLVDDVRVYNRALSAEEIDRLYRSRIYTRDLTVSNVGRDGSGNIGGAEEDPSTQKITASTTWRDGTTVTADEYLTRFRNEIDHVTDWSDETSYADKKDIDTTTTPGEITIVEEPEE